MISPNPFFPDQARVGASADHLAALPPTRADSTPPAAPKGPELAAAERTYAAALERVQAAVGTLADARAEIKEAEARLTTVKAAVLERVEALAADALGAARADLKEATARLTAVK